MPGGTSRRLAICSRGARALPDLTTKPSTARLNVIECAIVNAVTMPATSKNAWRNVATACHLQPRCSSTARSDDKAQHREAQCDRMRDRECRDDAGYFEKCLAERRDGLPSAAAVLEHCPI